MKSRPGTDDDCRYSGTESKYGQGHHDWSRRTSQSNLGESGKSRDLFFYDHWSMDSWCDSFSVIMGRCEVTSPRSRHEMIETCPWDWDGASGRHAWMPGVYTPSGIATDEAFSSAVFFRSGCWPCPFSVLMQSFTGACRGPNWPKLEPNGSTTPASYINL